MKRSILTGAVLGILCVVSWQSRTHQSESVQAVPDFQGLVADQATADTKENLKTTPEVLPVFIPPVELRGPQPAAWPDIRTTARADITQSEISITHHPTDPDVILAAANLTAWDDDLGPNGLVRVGIYWSTDGGITWSSREERDAGLWLRADPAVGIRRSDGAFIVNGLEEGHPGIAVAQGIRYSLDGGINWSAATVHNPDDNPGVGEFADKNHMAVDNDPTSPWYGRVYVAWTNVATEPPVYNAIQLRHSDDLVNWSPVRDVANEAIPPGNFFQNLKQGVNLQVDSAGTVHACWSNYAVDLLATVDGEIIGPENNEVSIGYSRSFDGGVTWESPRAIMPNMLGHRGERMFVDSNDLWKIRHNSFPVMGLDRSGGPFHGSVYICWTNIGEPGVNVGDTDTYVVISRDGGDTFDEADPVRVNGDATTSSQYFPWLSCDNRSGSVAVLYLDRREDPADRMTTAYVSISSDGGKTWVDQPIGDSYFHQYPFFGQHSDYSGDYIGASFAHGELIGAWSDPQPGTGRHLMSIQKLPGVGATVVKQFAKKSEETTLTYAETPYASIPFDYDGDGDHDFVTSSPGGPGAIHQALPQSEPPKHGIPRLVDQTTTLFGFLAGPNETRDCAIGDFDGDHRPDLFFASKTDPKLYRNDLDTTTSKFTSVEDSVGGGISFYSQDSWTATWVDYDRDGDLDLFVGRAGTASGDVPFGAINDELFRNEGNGTFYKISGEIGLNAAGAKTTIAAAWADLNGDGEPDLFVGERGPTGDSALYIHTISSGDHILTPRDDLLPSDPSSLAKITDVEWADMNNDGDVDLVLAGRGSLGFDGSRILWNDGLGDLTQTTSLAGGVRAEKIAVGDIDSDGYLDAVAIPVDANLAPWLLRNLHDDPQPTFIDQAIARGLGDTTSEGYRSLIVADLTDDPSRRDGDMDVYLGRPSSTKKFFYENEIDALSLGGTPEYVIVSLDGMGAAENLPSWGNNDRGLGTRIVVTSPPGVGTTLRRTHIVGGGSSSDAAASSEITIPLGVGVGDVEVKAIWPDGSETAVTKSGTDSDRTVQLTDSHLPGLIAASAGMSVLAEPGGTADWVFAWQTQYSSDPTMDQVTVKSEGSGRGGCSKLDPTTLSFGEPGVSVSVTPIQGGGYLHELTWNNRPCEAPCPIDFKVTSGNSIGTESSIVWKSFTLTICVQ